MNCLLNYNKVE